jgi:hypothetical protein
VLLPPPPPQAVKASNSALAAHPDQKRDEECCTADLLSWVVGAAATRPPTFESLEYKALDVDARMASKVR